MSDKSLVLSGDVLIFTDIGRLSGGVIDDPENPKARCVTSGLARLLEDLFFDPERTETPTLEEIRYHGVDANLHAADARIGHDIAGLERFVEAQYGFSLGERLPMGPVSTESFDEDGVLPLDESAVWRPAGDLATRTVGEHTFTFVVTPVDLQGLVREDARLDAVAAVREGARLRFTDTGCSSCPVCAGCALCVACGEVNADSAVATAVAAVSVAPQSASETFDPIAAQKLVDDAVAHQRAFHGVQPRIGAETPVGH